MELICQPLDIVIVNCCALCNLNRNQMGFYSDFISDLLIPADHTVKIQTRPGQIDGYRNNLLSLFLPF